MILLTINLIRDSLITHVKIIAIAIVKLIVSMDIAAFHHLTQLIQLMLIYQYVMILVIIIMNQFMGLVIMIVNAMDIIVVIMLHAQTA